MSTIQDVPAAESKRPFADFPPCVWGDYFLNFSDHSHWGTYMPEEKMKQKVEELKEEVKTLLTDSNNKSEQNLELIDAIQRLGVSYHFEREIDQLLENMHHNYSLSRFVDIEDHDDLYTVALWFRLLRQHGYYISPDVFNQFKDEQGKSFKGSLTMDLPGMLSLYEAAHLRIRGEEILDEAKAFSTTHLQLMQGSGHISPLLAEKITWALNHPIRKNLPRLETRHYISIYPKQDSYDGTLLKLAELDFNVLQALHRKEASNIARWCKEMEFAVKFPYARDRAIEVYFWIFAIYFEPQYSLGREVVTKVLAVISLIDDTYDAHGTYEELIPFTQAIKRWDISAIDILPDYMKFLYQIVIDVYKEIEEQTAMEGMPNFVSYAIETLKELVQAYFQEATWLHEAYTPTMEEYMSVGVVSAACSAILTASFVMMGKIATKEAFEWASNKPKIFTAASTISRLMNDIVSHEFEQKRGHVASAVECCMKERGVEEEEACKLFGEEIENAWKDINQDYLLTRPTPGSTTSTVVANPKLLDRILNLARVTYMMYHTGDDSYTYPDKLKHNVALLLLDPIKPVEE